MNLFKTKNTSENNLLYDLSYIIEKTFLNKGKTVEQRLSMARIC